MEALHHILTNRKLLVVSKRALVLASISFGSGGFASLCKKNGQRVQAIEIPYAWHSADVTSAQMIVWGKATPHRDQRLDSCANNRQDLLHALQVIRPRSNLKVGSPIPLTITTKVTASSDRFFY